MTTDLQVLDQACRNTLSPTWLVLMRVPGWDNNRSIEVTAGYRVSLIRDEYNRLLRLKNSKRGKYRAQA